MIKRIEIVGLTILSLIVWVRPCYSADNYQNFKVAVYARAYEVRQMGDLSWLEPRWNELTRQVKVDKIYLETHRDLILVDEDTLAIAREFFESRGIEVAGGITLTVSEMNRFETFCYANPDHRQKVREIVEYTARFFDEIILDDFFFTNCKCELCIQAKGDRSWTEYRLELLDEAARELIIGPAKAVNPDVKVVIKYPNWYEHFQGLGFNLETEPEIFDGLYTGTETRDPSGNQHLQQYLGYLNFRYFENLKPGGNGGGWVDTGGMIYMDRYAEQLWLTLFAKAPEITLFDFRQMQANLRGADDTPWQGLETSFSYDEMMQPILLANGETVQPTTIARAAGYTLEKADQFLGRLGEPIGVKSYKPYHSTGEDFLQNYLGMCGIPMDIVSEFPTDDGMILLTESAKFDPNIVDRVKGQLMDGKSVMITSGLLRALPGNGIEDIVELQYTDRKAIVKDFRAGWFGTSEAEQEMVIPQIQYLTNDSWEEISAIDETNGWPMLISAGYANGTLYVLTIPESFTDLYNLPQDVLTRIRETLTRDLYVRIDSPGQVALFVYDNDTFIVESFLPEPVEVRIVTDERISELQDVLSGEVLSGTAVTGVFGAPSDQASFTTEVNPHSYRAFQGR